MNRLRRYFLPALVAGLASAATTLTGPVAGYVTDSSRTQLRTIYGVPGAYQMGDPLPLPERVTQVRLAPGQDFALVESAQGGPGVLFLTNGGVDHLTPITGAMTSADWIAFSPGAGAAMAFSAANHRLQVWSGLPNAPQVTLDLDASTLPDTPMTGAVNDAGSLAVMASSSTLYRVSGGGAQVLLSIGGIASVTVLRNGADVAVSDPSTGSLQIVRNAATNPQARVLASGIDGLGAMFPSYDGQAIVVARPGASSISSVDLNTGEVKSFGSSVSPAGLVPLRNHDTFLISARAQEAGWVFYRDGAGGRVVFIPATPSSGREHPVQGGIR